MYKFIEQGGTGKLEQGGTGKIEQGGTGKIEQGGTGKIFSVLAAIAFAFCSTSAWSQTSRFHDRGLMVSVSDYGDVQISYHADNGVVWSGASLLKDGFASASLHPTHSTSKIVQGGTGNYKIVEGGTGNHKIVEGGTGNYKIVEGGTGNSKIVQGGTGNSKIVEGGTGNSKIVQGGTGNGKIVQGGTGNATVIEPEAIFVDVVVEDGQVFGEILFQPIGIDETTSEMISETFDFVAGNRR